MSATPASIPAPISSTLPVAQGQSHSIVTSYGDGSFESPAEVKDTVISYPLDTEGVVRTYASYNKQPIPELANHDHDSWNLCLSITVPPELIKPTLMSVVYVVKYATTWDNGSSTVQTDVVLTDIQSPHGISYDSNELGFYRKASGYSPRLIDEDRAIPLVTVQGVKGNTGVGQWSHYIDQQRLTPKAHLTAANNLYVIFHVHEYPTPQTSRCLAVEACATWLDDQEARAEAERLAKEEADRIAAAEAERKAREAEAARQAMEAAIKVKVDELERKLMAGSAPPAAPENVKAAFAKLGRTCSSGYSFRDNPAKREWRCVQKDGSFGTHAVSYEELERLQG